MIIEVNNGERQAIDGLARDAVATFKGDVATVSIATGDLIARPTSGRQITLSGGQWIIDKVTTRDRLVVTFICRRLADG